MSSKKARLVVINNFNIISFHNLYTNKLVSTNNLLTKAYTIYIKKHNYKITNNKSFNYSSIYKNLNIICSKNRFNLFIYSYPLYMKKFMSNLSSHNYSNRYLLKNINHLTQNKILNKHLNNLFYKKNLKFYFYKQQSKYFNSIYKYYYRNYYEHEDQNKLLYRKLNLYRYNSFEYKPWNHY